MAKLKAHNLNKKIPVELKNVKNLALFVLNEEGIDGAPETNIIFVSDAEISKLNRKYKGTRKTTDVLCFCMFDGPVQNNENNCNKADIFISTDTAKKNSAAYNTRFRDEIYLYVIHGILHMLGYRDKTDREYKVMNKKQIQLLNLYLIRQKIKKKRKI